MKDLKIVSWIFILAGIVLVIAAAIWSGVDPYGGWGAMPLSIVGLAVLLPIGLLGLIVFYVYSPISERRERPQEQVEEQVVIKKTKTPAIVEEQVVIKKTKTPAIAGILYIILPLFYIFFYSILEMRIFSYSQIFFIPFFIAGLTGIFAGICLLLRRFWWLSLTGAVLVIILVPIPFGCYSYIVGFDVVPVLPFLLLLLLILLLVLVLRSKKEFR
jgi:MFS family permease